MGLVPTKPYEDLLGDALDKLLADTPWTLEKFVDGLNGMNMPGPNGERWTADLFVATMARLGY